MGVTTTTMAVAHLIESHVERTVVQIREAARRVVDLTRAEAGVDQRAVDDAADRRASATARLLTGRL